MIDMTNNRVPYGLLTDEEKAALHEHEKAGGEFEAWLVVDGWLPSVSVGPRYPDWVYRAVPLPKTQDVIAWDRLPEWVEWVARDGYEEDNRVYGYSSNPYPYSDQHGLWMSQGERRRIDDFPGIVQIGTCDWKDSKQRRPRG
jgi:hypothetical protein